jgi:hypothetical protein
MPSCGVPEQTGHHAEVDRAKWPERPISGWMDAGSKVMSVPER